METSVTPSPSSTTVPAASCPSTTGIGDFNVPWITDRSLRQIPLAATSSLTSPAFGLSISTSAISSVLPTS